MCGIGSDARGASYAIKERLLAKLWFLLDKQDLFKVGAIALEALSENDGWRCRERCDESCLPPKFFETQPIANSADEKERSACTGCREQIAVLPGTHSKHC
jgi:hypothetical protein